MCRKERSQRPEKIERRERRVRALSEILFSSGEKKWRRHVRNGPEEIARTMGANNGGPQAALDKLKGYSTPKHPEVVATISRILIIFCGWVSYT
jgi:hypothetical protein